MFVDRLGFGIGDNYLIRFYALALLAGIVAAGLLIAYRAKRAGEDPEHVWNGIVWVVLAGIVGARIYHVLTPPPSMGITTWEYITDPLRAINIRSGGLGVPGALIGGGLAAFLYAKKNKMNIWVWFDLIMPGVALGQAIGRIGNFVNYELYGRPTDLPWAVAIPPEYRVRGYEAYSRFHPMFLYEAIMNLAICGGLIWIERRFPDRLRPGDLLGFYMVFYGGGRFFLEFVKLDAPAFGSAVTIAQVVSLAAAVVGVAFLVIRHRTVPAAASTEPAR